MKTIILKTVVILPLLFCFGCMTQPAVDCNELLQRYLIRTNQNIEKLNYRIATILSTIDQHEKTIRDLKNTLEIKTKQPALVQDREAGYYEKPYSPPVVKKQEEFSETYPSERPSSTRTEAAKDIYRDAVAKYNYRDFAKSLSLFRNLVQTYPDHYLAPKALYWIRYIEENVKQDKSQTRSEDDQELYAEGLRAFKSQDYDRATSLFSAFVHEHPAHNLADDAIYWKGECQYIQHYYYDSILTFKDMLGKYPRGDKVPEALLKIGYAYLALDDPGNAQIFLSKVIQNHPSTISAVRARQQLNLIQKRKDSTPSTKKDDSLQVYLGM